MPFTPPSRPTGLPDAMAYSAARYTLLTGKLLMQTVAGIYADRVRQVATWAVDPSVASAQNLIYTPRTTTWELVQMLSPEVAQLAGFMVIRTLDRQYWQASLRLQSWTAIGAADPVTGDTVAFEYRSPTANQNPSNPMLDVPRGTGPEEWDRETTVIGPCVVSPNVSTSRLQRLTMRLVRGGLSMGEMYMLGIGIYEVPYRTLEET